MRVIKLPNGKIVLCDEDEMIEVSNVSIHLSSVINNDIEGFLDLLSDVERLIPTGQTIHCSPRQQPVNDPMKPLLTCPVCGNDKDGTIQMTAVATATVENGSSLLYEDCFVPADSRTWCMDCDHVGIFADFKEGVKALTPAELYAAITFLQKVAKDFKDCHGEYEAKRCIGLLRRSSKILAPAVAGE